MKFNQILLLAGLLACCSNPAQAGLQIGIGPSLYSGTEFDEENGYGINAEIGFLFADQPVDLFLGVKATYVEGLGSGDANLDTFEGALAARVLVPLGGDWLKGYVEGSLGTANLSVSGQGSSVKVKDRTFSYNNTYSADEWVFAYGLGVGVQFDFTSWFGVRLGYEFHNFGDVEAFGLKVDPGSLNGFVGSIVLKF